MLNIKAALYCRISKEDENGDKSESILNQRSLLENYCTEHGYEVFDVYIDEDFSGIRRDRPAFNRMIKDAEMKKFQLVICKTLSRFSRDMTVVENLVNNKFNELGIRFISIVDNSDSHDKSNKKTRQINSLINEWYLEDLSDNIRAVFRDKMRKGECLFAYAPYGYKKDLLKKNHLVADSVVSGNVKIIFKMYNQGYSLGCIADYLNANNISSPLDYRNGTNIGLWTSGSVKDILKNPVYTGDLVQNRRKKLSYKSQKRVNVPEIEWLKVKGTHEAIIDKEIYEITKFNLSKKRRCDKNGKYIPLSGIVYCVCGSKCILKNKKIQCKTCKNFVMYDKLVSNLVKKLQLCDTVLFDFTVNALIEKVIIGEKTINIVWKTIE